MSLRNSFEIFEDSHDSVITATSQLLVTMVGYISSSLLTIDRVVLKKKNGKSYDNREDVEALISNCCFFAQGYRIAWGKTIIFGIRSTNH